MDMAIEKTDISKIEQIIKDKTFDINKVINYGIYKGLTPLAIACERGNEPVVKLLLEHGATIDERSLKLAEGLKFFYKEMFRLIQLASDYDVQRKWSLGKNFIRERVADKDFLSKRDSAISTREGIKQVIEYKDKYEGWTPLAIACDRRDGVDVKLLLERGTTIDQKSLEIAEGLKHFYPEMLRLIKLASDYDKARANSRGKEFIESQFKKYDQDFLSKRDSALPASIAVLNVSSLSFSMDIVVKAIKERNIEMIKQIIKNKAFDINKTFDANDYHEIGDNDSPYRMYVG